MCTVDEPALLREPAVHRRGVHRAASGEGVGDLGDAGARGRGRAADRLGVGAGGHPERAGALEAVRHRGERQPRRVRPAGPGASRRRARGSTGRGTCRAAPGRCRRSRGRRPGSGGSWSAARCGRARGPPRSSTPTADGSGRAAATRCARRARGAGPSIPVAAARSVVRGSRGRSRRRPPRPGWPAAPAPAAGAAGSAGRKRSGRRSAARAGRGRSRTPPGRRSPPSRCAWASWGTRRPGWPGPAAGAAHSCTYSLRSVRA